MENREEEIFKEIDKKVIEWYWKRDDVSLSAIFEHYTMKSLLYGSLNKNFSEVLKECVDEKGKWIEEEEK